ncbi:MAG: hypothetical protein ACON4M_03915 [Crocinitomicaceae bacterium]
MTYSSSMKFKSLFLFIVILSFQNTILSQKNIKDSVIGAVWVAPSYGLIWPKGDIAEKFGQLNHIGLLTGYKTSKNWFYGIESNFIFGNQVNLNNMFSLLLDNKGNITDINGDIAVVVVSARGFNFNLSAGKVIPIFGSNKNSGLFINGGFGILGHKYRIDTQEQVIPQIELNYRKGYDRFSMGPNFHQFVGYAFMSNKGLINFYTGFYAQEGFTKNQRTIFFDQPDTPVSKSTMYDYQFGIKFGWFVPISKRLPQEFYID